MSPSVEPSWPTPLEPCDTLHGGLQRGRGDAVLAALERADDEARALLLDCILRDPRGNQQDESRAVAYGELAWTLALDVEPLVERVRTCDPTDEFSEGADYRRDAGLARDVLCELARRGHRRALEVLRDYVAWGHRWNWVLRGLAEDGDLERVRGLDEVIARRF
ncbi:MAG: hypothetical protein HZA53_06500 [Planctomycetes bacterium]|nr:hypothetical protein [Planctomycetota bacterium]